MIDIIIPTIDSPQILQKALESIEKTTSDLSKVHIYIISDQSKYEYSDLIKSMKSLDITLLYTEKRSGPGPARNLGISKGTSPYISFLDGDDIYQDDILKYCNDKYDFISTRITLLSDDYNKTIYEYAPMGGVHGLIISRSFLNKIQLSFPNVKYNMEDTLFRLILFSASTNKLTHSSSFYLYQDNPNSCFMHNIFPIDNPELQDEEYDCYCCGSSWLSELFNMLKNLKLDNNILQSKYWNQTLTDQTIAMIKENPYCGTDLFVMGAAIILSFINIELLDFKNWDIEDLFILSFLYNNFSYDSSTNIITYSPDRNFYKKYLNLLDKHSELMSLQVFIKKYFYHFQPMIFCIDTITYCQRYFYNIRKQKADLM